MSVNGIKQEVCAMKVSEVMKESVVAASPSESLASVSRKMQTYGIGALPVMEADRLQGMVTDRDIVVRCIACHHDPVKMKVSEIMSTGATCVSPEHTISEAAAKMGAAQVRRLPVVKNNQVLGIITLGDIVKEKTDSEVARALYNISQPASPGPVVQG
ncbi:CBS domain-containing protein [Zongyangia hominis]|uniref:CBS domain-containing protein n=1 Tax=Zongyangia hominis TaxID=2763677 RepID=A0A926ICP0_9FIRM|nr:CBS domain-containing protein [Zongyangia hominis]MBC8571320.1 CBS domain-containing protein [Zongyangia hominis]